MNNENGERSTHQEGIARPHEADASWSRMQPLYIQPSRERMDKPHQIVDIKNNSDTEVGVRGTILPTKHIVIDRFNQGHELQPGQTKRGIDMLADDIKYFIRERRTGRVDHMGRLKPKHPIEILGFDPDNVLPGQSSELNSAPQSEENDRERDERDHELPEAEERARIPRERPRRERASRE